MADGCEVPEGSGQKGLMANVIIPHDTCRAGGSLSRHSNGRESRLWVGVVANSDGADLDMVIHHHSVPPHLENGREVWTS